MADFTIASQIAVPKVDPLALAGTLQSLKGQQIQNRILEQKASGGADVAKAISGATDPETGKVDWVKASSMLPEGSFGAPDLAERSIANQQGQQALTTAKVQQHIAEMGLTAEQRAQSAQELGFGAQLGQGILANGKADPAALTKQAITQSIHDYLIKPGIIRSEDGIAHARDFVGKLTDDPATNARLVQQWVNQSTDITKALGATQNIDTGGGIAVARVNPATGKPTVGGIIDKSLSPSEATSVNRTYTDANGVVHQVLKGQDAAALATGKTDNPEGFAATPPAGTVEAQQATKAASATQYTADVNDAGGFAQRMQGLQNAEKALKGAQSGKGGQALQDWRAVLNTLGVPLSAEDKAKAVNFDEAKKYLTDYANRRGAALGMGTDAGREMIHAANPSVDINKPAALDILKVIKGLERMQNAQQALAAQQGVQPGDYASWRAGWNRSVDPAAFMADQIPAAQRVKTYDAMKPAQQKKYVNGVKAAIAAGYFAPEDLRQ